MRTRRSSPPAPVRSKPQGASTEAAWAERTWRLIQEGELAAAQAHCRNQLARQPHHGDALHFMGMIAFRQRQYPEALTWLRRAQAALPDNPGCLNSLGNALREAGEPEAAVTVLQHCLRLAPGLAPAQLNLGLSLKQLARLDEAAACFRRALELFPDFAEARYNLGLLELQAGRLREGWEHYEARWLCRDLSLPRRVFAMPPWNGEPLDESQPLLVHAEQGLGDTVQFLRFLPMARQRASRILLEVPPALRTLVGGSCPEVEVIPHQDPPPRAHRHLPLLSLPRVLGVGWERIPVPVPYLAVPDARIAPWRARLESLGPGLKVGVAWAGNPDHNNDHRRSLSLSQLAPLFALEGVRWISLQKGAAADQIRSAGASLVDWSGEWPDLLETAGLIAALDGVVSVDTVIAHLAGALAVPTRILLPVNPDWRWLLEREDSPWYPTVRLMRQTVPGAWEGPVDRLAQELAALYLAPTEGQGGQNIPLKSSGLR